MEQSENFVEPQKVKNKRMIVITIISVLVMCCLSFFLLALIDEFNRSSDTPPVSYPIDENRNGNTVEVVQGSESDFAFAVITNNNRIELRNRKDENLIINLQNRNWKEIKWSPDNKNISVLGESSEGVFDLFIYNLENKNWNKLTSFNLVESGITSYSWINNDFIYFLQGEDKWLHRVNIHSNELLKVVRQDGEIVRTFPSANSILIKHFNTFLLLNLIGDEVNSFETVTYTRGFQTITEPIKDIFIIEDTDNTLILSESGEVIIGDENTEEWIQLSLPVDSNVLCIRDNNITSFTFNEGVMHLTIFDNKNGDLKFEVERALNQDWTYDYEKSICFNEDNVLIKMDLENQPRWYRIEGDRFIEAGFMDSVKEIISKNI